MNIVQKSEQYEMGATAFKTRNYTNPFATGSHSFDEWKSGYVEAWRRHIDRTVTKNLESRPVDERGIVYKKAPKP